MESFEANQERLSFNWSQIVGKEAIAPAHIPEVTCGEALQGRELEAHAESAETAPHTAYKLPRFKSLEA